MPDVECRVDYLGTGTYAVARLVRTHAAHFTGRTWQIRHTRGTWIDSVCFERHRHDA